MPHPFSAARRGTRFARRIMSAFEALKEKIESYSQLLPDWNSYGAVAPNSVSILASIESLQYMRVIGLMPKNLAPSAENGIGFTFENEEKFAHLEFFNDGMAVVLMDSGTAQDRQIWEFEIEESSEEMKSSLDRIKEWVTKPVRSEQDRR